MMRTYTENYLSKVANLKTVTCTGSSSPGNTGLSQRRLVAAGRTLEARRSESRPDRGIVRTFIEVLNQKREVVIPK